MARILIADDEQELLNIFSRILKEAGHEIDTVSDGAAAMQKLKSGAYSLVLSDFRMPKVSGGELLQWIRQQKIDVKVILMTGLSQLGALKFEDGVNCDGILPKPVTKDELLKVVASIITSGAEPNLTFEDGRYGRVPIEDFISGRSIAYAIYAKFPDGRFRKIANMGDDLDMALIQKLKDEGINELFLEQSDFQHYTELATRLAQLAMLRSEFSEDKRAYLIKNACEVAQENLRVAGFNQQSIQSSQKSLEVSIRMLGNDQSVVTLLEMIESSGSDTFSHGAVCGLLCSMITKVMGWSSQRNIVNLTLGGFLHDIGLAELPVELRTMAFDKMNAEQKLQYMRHPAVGAEKLLKLPKVSRELVTIVLQHHENPRGTGYPAKLTRAEIFPMAAIVSTVERYAEALQRQDPSKRKKPFDLFEEMINDDPYGYDSHAAMALSLMLKHNNIDDARAAYLVAAQKAPK